MKFVECWDVTEVVFLLYLMRYFVIAMQLGICRKGLIRFLAGWRKMHHLPWAFFSFVFCILT